MSIGGVARITPYIQGYEHKMTGTCYCETCKRWYYVRECRTVSGKFYCPKGHENRLRTDFAYYL